MAYWLMKSEPGEYSIDDLERDGMEPWDGIRNYQVRNMIRDAMQVSIVVVTHELQSAFEIADLVAEFGGESLHGCMQCGTCTGVCPWNRVSGNNPRSLLRQISLGDEVELELSCPNSACRMISPA